MKMLLNILIMVVKMCASESSVYDWHVKTIESDSDFGDALKVETALNNERQQDLFKISGKTNNIEYYPNSYYDPFNNNVKEKSNKPTETEGKNRNFFKDKYDIRHEDEADFKSLFDQKSSITRKQDSKIYNKNNYSNYSGNKYNNDKYNKYKINEYDMFPNPQRLPHEENPKEFTTNLPNINDKHSNDRGENNHNNVVAGGEKKEQKINITDHTKTKIENKQTSNDKDDKNFKKNKEFTSVNNCSGKYVDIESFVGTNLFDSTAKKCFSSEDVALLTIRKDLENLIPKNLPQCLFDDNMVALLINYFYICHQMIIQSSSINCRHLAEKAFYDTLGGYLNFYMVPVTKYSYYAGQISLTAAQQVLNLHQESRKFLNTNGNGWKAPLQNVLKELESVHIEPLPIPELNEDARNEASFCMQIAMNSDDYQPDNDKIIVRLPKLETENVKGFLGNIWLPFRRKKNFDLKSESSTYIVVKFYEIVTKCYRFENIDQEFYNQQFKTWLMENIHTHLSDEEFYPGLGAVLRICEYLKGRRKNVIGIGRDLSSMENMDGKYNKYRNHPLSAEQINKRKRTQYNKAQENHNHLKKPIDNDLREFNRNNVNLSKDIIDQETKTVSEKDKDNKLEAAIHSMSKNSKAILRSLALTPAHMTIIAISGIAIFLIIIICCWKCFCKKKKLEIPINLKNSSSSSSNLLNPPVRFFNIRRKSASSNTAMDYLSNESGKKKNKKSVKMEKKSLINSDSSISNSPIRNTKSKESTGRKDKAKSKESDKK